MHGEETQRALRAISRAGEAAAPLVEHELARAYGPAWLEQVNAGRAAHGYSTGRGAHDHRFVLALVAHDPALVQAFDPEQRKAARLLNGIGNAIAHNEPLSRDDPRRAEELAQRLVGGGAGGVATDGGTLRQLSHDIQRLAGEGRHGEVLTLAERWIALEPENPHAWSWKTFASYYRGHPEEARAAAQRWLALQPDDPNARSWKSWCEAPPSTRDQLFHGIQRLVNEGRHGEALALAERWSALEPQNPNPWSWKAELLGHLRRQEEALAAAERWLALRPDDPNAWSCTAVRLQDLERTEEALYAVERWIALEPGNAYAWWQKGLALARLERYEAALAAADQSIALGPRSAGFWSGKPKLAINHWDVSDPWNPPNQKVVFLIELHGTLLGVTFDRMQEALLAHCIRSTYRHCASNGLVPRERELVKFMRAMAEYQRSTHGAEDLTARTLDGLIGELAEFVGDGVYAHLLDG